jgi:hypothetical protein
MAEIPLAATRCKFCCIDIVLTPEDLALMEKLAEERLFSGKGLMGWCAG